MDALLIYSFFLVNACTVSCLGGVDTFFVPASHPLVSPASRLARRYWSDEKLMAKISKAVENDEALGCFGDSGAMGLLVSQFLGR